MIIVKAIALSLITIRTYYTYQPVSTFLKLQQHPSNFRTTNAVSLPELNELNRYTPTHASYSTIKIHLETNQPSPYLRLRLHTLLSLLKPQTNTINTVPLIRRCRKPLSLKNMPQMTPTVTAYNLRPLHPKGVIRMPRHSTGDRIKICGPAAAGLKFVCRLI